jgi:hypothetical protein
VRIGFGITQVIDGYDLDFVRPAVFMNSAHDVTADTSISIDCNFYSHVCSSPEGFG